jgi:hypothetical protein
LVEAQLRQLPGVKDAQANPLTGNVLIHFEDRADLAEAVLAALRQWSEPASVGARADSGRVPPVSPLLRVGVRGLLGHAVVDSLWFAAGFLGKSLGLPLAGLGPLHVATDLAVWGMALRCTSLSNRS